MATYFARRPLAALSAAPSPTHSALTRVAAFTLADDIRRIESLRRLRWLLRLPRRRFITMVTVSIVEGLYHAEEGGGVARSGVYWALLSCILVNETGTKIFQSKNGKRLKRGIERRTNRKHDRHR